MIEQARILGFRWELAVDYSGSLWTVMDFGNGEPVEMQMIFEQLAAVPGPIQVVIRSDGRLVGEFPRRTASN